jgi:hypothetical protein
MSMDRRDFHFTLNLIPLGLEPRDKRVPRPENSASLQVML